MPYIFASNSAVVLTPLNNSEGTPVTITLSASPSTYNAVYSCTSGNTEVAVVSSIANGTFTITYVAPGTTQITVTDAGDTLPITIKVTAVIPTNPGSTVPALTLKNVVSGLVVTTLSIPSLNSTAELVLNWDSLVPPPSNTNVYWGSSNELCATVSSTGTITSISNGTTTITAYTQDGGNSASCVVTVGPYSPVTGLTFSSPKLTYTLGPGEQLDPVKSIGTAFSINSLAVVTPFDSTLYWRSSNSNLATVDNQGNITPYGYGNVTITVFSADGSKTANLALTFTRAIPASPVVLTFTVPKLSLVVGATAQAPLTSESQSSSSFFYYYPSSNIASVDSTGLITANAPGTANIVVVSKDGSKRATLPVTVTVPLTTLVINQGTSLTVQTGLPKTLTVTTVPLDATVPAIVWSSSDKTAVTVSTAGVVTALKSGFSTVTATCGTGLQAITASIYITAVVKTVEVDMNSISPQGYTQVINGVKTLTMAPGVKYTIPSVISSNYSSLSWTSPDSLLDITNIQGGTAGTRNIAVVSLKTSVDPLVSHSTTLVLSSTGSPGVTDVLNVVIPPVVPVTAIAIDTANIPNHIDNFKGGMTDGTLHMVDGNIYCIPTILSGVASGFPTNRSITWSVSPPGLISIIPNNGTYPSCNISILPSAAMQVNLSVTLTATTVDGPYSVDLPLTINAYLY